MSSRQHLGIGVLLLLVVVGAGGMLFIWPAYREAAAVNEHAAELRRKGEDYDSRAQVIHRLTADLQEASRRVETEFKHIPESPGVAGLMRVLSLPVDGQNIHDQTFTAGEAKEAAPGSDISAMAMPLTVDMVARFDSIFALIRAAESMHRLLRIASVNVGCNRQEDEAEPFARASVVIEAVYDPPGQGEER
ncbi:MAG: type 4a pilus biogenesis protein PilO [Planctomycetota bacterium]|jgi:Tfp pilus assembly protein PilO